MLVDFLHGFSSYIWTMLLCYLSCMEMSRDCIITRFFLEIVTSLKMKISTKSENGSYSEVLPNAFISQHDSLDKPPQIYGFDHKELDEEEKEEYTVM